MIAAGGLANERSCFGHAQDGESGALGESSALLAARFRVEEDESQGIGREQMKALFETEILTAEEEITLKRGAGREV
jgi:hypothetical protein